jgi:hypothetical protein
MYTSRDNLKGGDVFLTISSLHRINRLCTLKVGMHDLSMVSCLSGSRLVDYYGTFKYILLKPREENCEETESVGNESIEGGRYFSHEPVGYQLVRSELGNRLPFDMSSDRLNSIMEGIERYQQDVCGTRRSAIMAQYRGVWQDIH